VSKETIMVDMLKLDFFKRRGINDVEALLDWHGSNQDHTGGDTQAKQIIEGINKKLLKQQELLDQVKHFEEVIDFELEMLLSRH